MCVPYNAAHYSIEETVQGIYANYWFKSMRKKVKEYIDNCVVCLISNTSIYTKEGDLQIGETPDNDAMPFDDSIH